MSKLTVRWENCFSEDGYTVTYFEGDAVSCQFSKKDKMLRVSVLKPSHHPGSDAVWLSSGRVMVLNSSGKKIAVYDMREGRQHAVDTHTGM